jgi:hypothetical protein
MMAVVVVYQYVRRFPYILQSALGALEYLQGFEDGFERRAHRLSRGHGGERIQHVVFA